MNTDDQAFWNTRWQDESHRRTNPFAQDVVTYVQNPAGKTLLDIGCGDGRDSLFFAEKGFHVTAIDISESGIQELMERAPAIDARFMDITQMDFPDESFDVIYAHLSLHYFNDKTTKRIFERIRRMLKPDGFFFIVCKSTNDPLYGVGENLGPDMYRSDHLRHFFSEEYMHKCLKDFDVLILKSSEDHYDGHRSAFISAVSMTK